MSTTINRTSFCQTTETKRQLDWLCKIYGENKSQVITRAIERLFLSEKYGRKHSDDIQIERIF